MVKPLAMVRTVAAASECTFRVAPAALENVPLIALVPRTVSVPWLVSDPVPPSVPLVMVPVPAMVRLPSRVAVPRVTVPMAKSWPAPANVPPENVNDVALSMRDAAASVNEPPDSVKAPMPLTVRELMEVVSDAWTTVAALMSTSSPPTGRVSRSQLAGVPKVEVEAPPSQKRSKALVREIDTLVAMMVVVTVNAALRLSVTAPNAPKPVLDVKVTTLAKESPPVGALPGRKSRASVPSTS